MPNQNKNTNFNEKSDYEKKLIEFTRAVNAQSDNLRKAYVEQAQDRNVLPASPENSPEGGSASKLGAYAF